MRLNKYQDSNKNMMIDDEASCKNASYMYDEKAILILYQIPTLK